MAQRDKLLAKICENPKDVRFDDACKAAEWLGFVGKGGKGSHHAFSKPGEPTGLNFQKRAGGKIAAYQARQLIAMIEKCTEQETESGGGASPVEAGQEREQEGEEN